MLLPWPDSVLCEELCCHRHHPRWERSCSGRVKTKIPPYVKCNNLELVRRQQISRGFCHCSKCPSSVCPSGERTERVRAQRDGARCSGAAPGSRTGAQLQVCDTGCGQNRDAGHHGQTERAELHVSLLHFLTTSNIVIVTHNTREYNCCSDYLQPLH